VSADPSAGVGPGVSSARAGPPAGALSGPPSAVTGSARICPARACAAP
jgi:hypothetical protein